MTTRADHVRLWLDWCAATGVDTEQPTWADVEAFTRDVPAAEATLLRRLGAIRGHYAQQRRSLAGAPPVATERLWPATATPRAIASHLRLLPSYGWPEGITGRRDAVIVLLAAQGLTRREITVVAAVDADVSVVPTLRGVELPRTVDTFGCSACALTRWLRVLDLWTAGVTGFHVLEELVAYSPADPGWHDCVTSMDGEAWRSARLLLVGVSSRGDLSTEPVGVRSVTSAVGAARAAEPTVADPIVDSHRSPDRGLSSLSPAQRHAQLRDLDALLDRLDQLLEDATRGR